MAEYLLTESWHISPMLFKYSTNIIIYIPTFQFLAKKVQFFHSKKLFFSPLELDKALELFIFLINYPT